MRISTDRNGYSCQFVLAEAAQNGGGYCLFKFVRVDNDLYRFTATTSKHTSIVGPGEKVLSAGYISIETEAARLVKISVLSEGSILLKVGPLPSDQENIQALFEDSAS